MITRRSVKGTRLTHDEVDTNFEACENLKGYDVPDLTIGVNGDHYTRIGYDEVLDAYVFNLTLESDRGNPYYSEGLFGSTEFANDLIHFEFGDDAYFLIEFTDNIGKYGYTFSMFGVDLELSAATWDAGFSQFRILNAELFAILDAAGDPITTEISMVSYTPIDQVDYVRIKDVWKTAPIDMLEGYVPATTLSLTTKEYVDGSTGTTLLRPTTPRIGLYYFDTDLAIPIWFNGTVWTDSAGLTV